MKIAAFGRTRMLYDSIKLLSQDGFEITAIGTCKESPESDITSEDFKKLAAELRVQFFNDLSINSMKVIDLLRRSRADIAISVNWLTMIGNDVISSFPYGVLNAHAGDLPRYRGNACPNWAILSGEQKVALTVHQMIPDELDSGGVLLKEYYPISLSTRIGEIYEFIVKTIPNMFLRAIKGLCDGSIRPTAQDQNTNLSLRCYPRIPSDSSINWGNSAEDILRLINASSEPFAGAYTYLNMEKIIVWRADIKKFDCPGLYIPGQVVFVEKATGNVGVAAKDGIVVLEEIQNELDYRTFPSDVIRSTRTRLGMNVEDELYRIHKLLAQRGFQI